jgi:hypothetical protein
MGYVSHVQRKRLPPIKKIKKKDNKVMKILKKIFRVKSKTNDRNN